VPSSREELELIAAVKAGDNDAFTKLLDSHKGLVAKYAWWERAKNLQADLEDLMQAGRLGIYHAARLFDEARGNKFCTLAVFWVRCYIQRESNHQRLIRTPTSYRYYLDDVRRAQNIKHVGRFTDKPHDADDDSTTMILESSVRTDEDVEDRERLAEIKSKMRELIARLPQRERIVIKGRFFRHLTLEEVGGLLGITKERARQMQSLALKRMKKWGSNGSGTNGSRNGNCGRV
jgi:RNA polymerase sigma factor (sigma-70 family)